jgi:hypothetical protein
LPLCISPLGYLHDICMYTNHCSNSTPLMLTLVALPKMNRVVNDVLAAEEEA